MKFFPGVGGSGFAAVVVALAVGFAAYTPAQTRNAPKAIHLTGCLEEGVEAGCYVLTDRTTGKKYNLYFQGEKPAFDLAIELNGLTRPGAFTTCMQGLPVHVDDWKQTSAFKCPAAADNGQKPQ
jgi:hypothetical protein